MVFSYISEIKEKTMFRCENRTLLISMWYKFRISTITNIYGKIMMIL